MIVVVVLLAIIAVVAIVLALVARARLTAQRAAAAQATAAAEESGRARDEAQARAEAAETARDEATRRATEAEARAAEAEKQAMEAEARAAEAEARAAEAEAKAEFAAAAVVRTGLDPELLWALERARSERTWRNSVAIGPDDTPVFVRTEHPLREALQVEVDAAREEVGAVVELEVDVPAEVTPAGSVLVLRVAQELLARAVKAAEETTLRVRADGSDVDVTVVATDEDGTTLPVVELPLPPSVDVEPIEGGVRVKRAIGP